MSNVTVLSVPGHTSSVESATRWLQQSKWDALLLDLPEDLENFVREYAEGEISEDEFWNGYRLMTGVPRPLLNSLRLKFKPLLRYLCDAAGKRKISVYCYEDLESHIRSGEFAEKCLLLSYRARVCRDLDLEQWRRVLLEGFHAAQSTWERSMENLIEKALGNVENAALYKGLIGPLVKRLAEVGLPVRVASMLSYCRPPLDVLRTTMWLKGSSYLTDNNLRKAIELHMKYLDIVLSSDDLDESQQKWTQLASFRRNSRSHPS